ncbi:MAG: amino-acid N-acetyltransferase [Chitinispirillia bacterium]|nr:amino-acid N-acetyltransferase [Chitinispirillia bacterium]MCL2269470.1 amino-acid N-acetyltransferase [Chitinispirillia bacterium]
MERISLKEQAEIIRQAFGYINRFKNETFVIKIDSVLIGHDLFPVLIKDLVLLRRMGIRIILVPGARTRINEVLSAYNVECPSVNGIRVSYPEAIPFIKMAAFDVSNRIMTMLAENEAGAIIGNWVKARGIGVRGGVDFQNSGVVENLQTGILNKMLDEGIIPIFPNIGWSAKGKPYNLSSSDLAFTISVQMKAAKLFFVTESGGIKAEGFKIPDEVYVSESDGTISQLTMAQAGQFLDLNPPQDQSDDTNLALISYAYRACKQGVRRVHIIDGATEGMILQEVFSNSGFGTMIYSNQLEDFRPMTTADIPGVLSLMQPMVDEGALVPRTAEDLTEKLDDYAVYAVDGTIHACGALHTYPGQQGEIAAIVVNPTYASRGVGKKIIEYLIEKATKIRLNTVFVLTTLTADWFHQLGFIKCGIDELPDKKREAYNKNRNSIVMKYPISNQRNDGGIHVE